MNREPRSTWVPVSFKVLTIFWEKGKEGREDGTKLANEADRPDRTPESPSPTEAPGERKVSSTSEEAKEEYYRGETDPLQALDEPRWSKHALTETRIL